jgi:hypothetical protein
VSSDRPLVVSLALRSYPWWWRERYGADAASTSEDLLTEGKSPLALAGGCFVGALKERLRGPGGSSSPIGPAERLKLSVIGTHGAWILAFPFALLVEVILFEQTAFNGHRGSDRRSLTLLFDLRVAAVVLGALAAALLGASVLAAHRRAGTATAGPDVSALQWKSVLALTLAGVVLVAFPFALDRWHWRAVLNWDPRFLFGGALVHLPIFAGPAQGIGVDIALMTTTWMVIVAGPVTAARRFSAATRGAAMTAPKLSRQALLGSCATIVLALTWVSLLTWTLVFLTETGSRFSTAHYRAAIGRPADVTLVLLGLMLLPLLSGLRSIARSWRAGVDLRHA